MFGGVVVSCTTSPLTLPKTETGLDKIPIGESNNTCKHLGDFE